MVPVPAGRGPAVPAGKAGEELKRKWVGRGSGKGGGEARKGRRSGSGGSGGSLVSKDIPPFVKAARFPITFVGANFIGLRRRGFTAEQIGEIQDIFRVLFQEGHSYGKACDIVMNSFPQSETRDEIIEFIHSSKRGILKPYNCAIAAEEE